MLNGLLDDFNPLPSGSDNTGDVEAAMEEMKQSKYDTNGDGKCDESPECNDVLELGSNIPPNTDMLPVVEARWRRSGSPWMPARSPMPTRRSKPSRG